MGWVGSGGGRGQTLMSESKKKKQKGEERSYEGITFENVNFISEGAIWEACAPAPPLGNATVYIHRLDRKIFCILQQDY